LELWNYAQTEDLYIEYFSFAEFAIIIIFKGAISEIISNIIMIDGIVIMD
jgi:hypothetical protein